MMTDAEIIAELQRRKTERQQRSLQLQHREERRTRDKMLRALVNATAGAVIAATLLIAQCAGMIAPELVRGWCNLGLIYTGWLIWQMVGDRR